MALVVSIPTDAVGLVIGKGGKNLITVQEESNAKLFLQSHENTLPGFHERLVIINGDKPSIISAIKLLMPSLIDRKSSSYADTGEEIVKWLIPSQLCGVLIGKNGYLIKKINTTSGACVKIAHAEEAAKGSEERLVYIRGKKSQVEAALKMVTSSAKGRPFESKVEEFNFRIQSKFMADAIKEISELYPRPRVMFNVDPNLDFKFVDLIKIRTSGEDSNVVNTIISKYALADVVPPSANEVPPAGYSYILKIVFTKTIFERLIQLQDDGGKGVVQSLKEGYNADFFRIPSMQLLSSTNSELDQCAFTCHSDKFYDALDKLLQFVGDLKDSSPFCVPVTNTSNGGNNSNKRGIDEVSDPDESGTTSAGSSTTKSPPQPQKLTVQAQVAQPYPYAQPYPPQSFPQSYPQYSQPYAQPYQFPQQLPPEIIAQDGFAYNRIGFDGYMNPYGGAPHFSPLSYPPGAAGGYPGRLPYDSRPMNAYNPYFAGGGGGYPRIDPYHTAGAPRVVRPRLDINEHYAAAAAAAAAASVSGSLQVRNYYDELNAGAFLRPPSSTGAAALTAEQEAYSLVDGYNLTTLPPPAMIIDKPEYEYSSF